MAWACVEFRWDEHQGIYRRRVVSTHSTREEAEGTANSITPEFSEDDGIVVSCTALKIGNFHIDGRLYGVPQQTSLFEPSDG